jgi:hypothetical protein
MNDIKKLFEALNISYDVLDEHEIIVPCPMDACETKKIYLSSDQIINDSDTGCLSDEVYIHISEDEKGYINWLVVGDIKEFN